MEMARAKSMTLRKKNETQVVDDSNDRTEADQDMFKTQPADRLQPVSHKGVGIA